MSAQNICAILFLCATIQGLSVWLFINSTNGSTQPAVVPIVICDG